MVTKVDPVSSIEPGRIQSTVSMSTSSIASASSPKVSKFGAKSGFVIPKNKLSGSLVPIFRGSGKAEGGSSVKEEGTKQVQRKTKWGTDLTQDAAVRKGRALAYQTRLEQITQQLSSGALEIADDQDLQGPKHAGQTNDEDHERAPQRIQSQKFEALELERREIIGEILRLNPSYKTPLDYKPLLKEAKVPIPNKAHSGQNFIRLLLGPENNTQKRLEEETGAKVRIQATKVDTGEKREITLSGFNDTQGVQDFYVHVSADTYEKVDAAVTLIELLLTPVSGSSAVASTNPSPAVGVSKESTSVFVTPPMNTVSQGMLQPLMPAQPAPAQFHPFPAPWFQTAQRPPSGFMPMPQPNNLVRFPPSPVGPGNPPYFGQPPFGSPRTPTNRPPMQVMQQHPITHPNRPMPGQQPPPAYSVMRPLHNPNALPFTAAQPMPSISVPMLNMPLRAPAPGNSPGWPSGPPIVSAPLRPSNVSQMAPPSVSQTSIASRPQQAFPINMPGRPPAANLAPPTNYTLRPSTTPPSFSSAPVISSGPPLSALMRPPPPSFPTSAPFMAQTSMPAQSVAPVTARPPVPLPLVSPVSGPAAGPAQSPHTIPPVTSIAPPPAPTITAPKPVRPSSGDFTFQPLNTQVPASPSPPASTPSVQSTSQVQPVAPQVPSFRPAVQSSAPAPPVGTAVQSSAPAPPVGTQGWPTVSSQAPVRPPPPISSNFSFNSTNIQLPPRLPFPSTTPGFSPASNFSPTTQLCRPVFPPASPASQMGRPVFPPRPSDPLQPYQNHLSRPSSITPLNQPFQSNPFSSVAGRPSPTPGGNQNYDPFSPTSISPQQGGDSVKVRKPEADAEYEDLMASVGVK